MEYNITDLPYRGISNTFSLHLVWKLTVQKWLKQEVNQRSPDKEKF